jgi:hypothetical protein
MCKLNTEFVFVYTTMLAKLSDLAFVKPSTTHILFHGF